MPSWDLAAMRPCASCFEQRRAEDTGGAEARAQDERSGDEKNTRPSKRKNKTTRLQLGTGMGMDGLMCPTSFGTMRRWRTAECFLVGPCDLMSRGSSSPRVVRCRLTAFGTASSPQPHPPSGLLLLLLPPCPWCWLVEGQHHGWWAWGSGVEGRWYATVLLDTDRPTAAS